MINSPDPHDQTEDSPEPAAQVLDDRDTTGQDGASTEVVPTDGDMPSTHRGLRWQKFAGIGPERGNRTAARSISGEAINSLGSLEAEIMGTLWEIGKPATSMDVAETMLYKRRGRGLEPASFATVTTTLRRLADKGLVTSEKGEQRTPYYAPTVGRAEMTARILNNVSVSLLGQSFSGLLPKLLGSYNAKASYATAQEQDEIARLMQALQNTDEQNIPDASPVVPEIPNAEIDQAS